jgi:uncharacterized protein YegL
VFCWTAKTLVPLQEIVSFFIRPNFLLAVEHLAKGLGHLMHELRANIVKTFTYEIKRDWKPIVFVY